MINSDETLIKLNKQYEKTIKELFRKINKLEKTIDDKNKIIEDLDNELKKERTTDNDNNK